MDGSATSPRPVRPGNGYVPRVRREAAAAPRPTPVAPPVSSWRRDLGLILLLVFLATGMRAWLLSHTEVAARDSIGFIRYALQMEREGWTRVVDSSAQHPGYPALILLVSWPVRLVCGGITPYSMQLSAQLASALASLLLIVPMYFLGRELFDRRAAFWGTALFQCLPASARVLADALSEATYLLLIVTALCLAVYALRRRSVVLFALSGLFGGLAYLTRPEGALVVVATLAALAGLQFSTWRRPWRQVCVSGLAVALAGLVAGSPYYLVTGCFTKKPTPVGVIQRSLSAEPGKPVPVAPEISSFGERTRVTGPLLASLWAVYAPDGLADKRLWAVRAVVGEVVRAYQYAGVVPLVLGLWWFRGRLKESPGAWAVLALCGLHALVLWRLGAVMGYVSDRHVLLLVLCGSFAAAAATALMGERLASWWNQRFATERPLPGRTAAVFLCLLVGFGLPEAFKTLHANRVGHRQAGLWLAQHTQPYDWVSDPFCWAHYYAGRVFAEALPQPKAPADSHPLHYVVLERSDHDHNRLPLIRWAEEQAARGRLVYHWPENRPAEQSKILVYATPIQ